MGFSARTRRQLCRYWAARLGVSPKAFDAPGITVGSIDEGGVQLFRHEDSLVVSAPASFLDAVERHAPALESLDFDDSDAVVEWFDSFLSLSKLLGPAFYGYTDREGFQPVSSDARLLGVADEPAFDTFQASVSDDEWDAGGPEFGPKTTVGRFVDGRLVAVAGYDVWDTQIAHISVVTHPDHRNAGHGRAVVSRVTELALSRGLLPQYRTLDAWPWSVALAENLGFERFATSYFGRFD
ncbi:GNAT family N-acetyltransferase [Haladaptatus sp. GCM10025707]|uniref:GNAT family N-acetyltransferase n=1 Tax=unclassified Haladaptatus TaxID=2622732 RepID=UPI0023E7C811|nr:MULTISPECIES: GNAT family N-acetyltransferase [unclassified Haladaptatus]